VTLVTDASVVVSALVDAGRGGGTARAALGADDDLLAPALLDVEVVHALRGRVLGKKLDTRLAGRAVADLATLPIRRLDSVPLLDRIWQLRGAITAYDAAYVALAEVFSAVLVTADARLVRANGPRCEFHLLVQPSP
jgi:predicted nucleic acid-binding protein